MPDAATTLRSYLRGLWPLRHNHPRRVLAIRGRRSMTFLSHAGVVIRVVGRKRPREGGDRG